MREVEHFNCLKCGAQWTQPVGMSAAITHEAATLIRRQQPIRATKLLRDSYDLSLRDAKAVMLHVSRESGKCHRCDSTLGDSVQCETCTALVLDW